MGTKSDRASTPHAGIHRLERRMLAATRVLTASALALATVCFESAALGEGWLDDIAVDGPVTVASVGPRVIPLRFVQPLTCDPRTES